MVGWEGVDRVTVVVAGSVGGDLTGALLSRERLISELTMHLPAPWYGV